MTADISSGNRIALIAVCLSALMLGLEITSVPSILPTLETVLPADFRQLQWIANAYTIAMCAALMAMGALADRFGRKRVFVWGTLVFAIASLLCGLANSAPLLVAARLLQGLSAAAMLACQVAVLSHQFRDVGRSKAFGAWGIVFGIGLGFGPIVGGAIVALVSWEWVFLIHVGLAMVTALCAARGVVESRDPSARRLDYAGMTTLSVAVFGIVYLITQGRPLGSDTPLLWTVLAIAIISLAFFIVIEMRVKRPMFDFSVFRVRRFSGALLGSSGMNFSFWPFVIYLPIYLQGVLGYSPTAAGLTVLAYTLPTIFVPPYAERLLHRRGPGTVIPLGLFTIGFGFVLLHVAIISGHMSWLTLLPGCLLAGIGLGLTNTPVTNTATAALPAERSGMASGMDMSARMISLAINIAIMGLLLSGGVAAHLTNAALVDPSKTIAAVADMIAAGNVAGASNFGVPLKVAREALSQGIGWVTLYGAIAAWLMSALSLTILRAKTSRHRERIVQSAADAPASEGSFTGECHSIL